MFYSIEKNRKIRNILLFFTISLFVIFIYALINSYIEYKNIQQRINSIYQSNNNPHFNNDSLVANFDETEKCFNNFALAPDIQHYISYSKKLSGLISQIDQNIVELNGPSSSIYKHFPTHLEKLNKDLAGLKIKITKTLLTATALRAIYDPAAMPINNEETTKLKERELIAHNFHLLYEIHQLILAVDSFRSVIDHKQTGEKLNILIYKTHSYKWQMIVTLALMFLLICILVYYQFFTIYFEKKLVEENLNASKLAEHKTDVLAEITHEIRTPINSLIGIIDILRRKSIFDKQDKILLESSFSHLTSTSKTINDILNLSRIDETKESDLRSFDIRELLLDIIELHQTQATLKGIKLAFEIPLHAPTIIYSDEFKIRQVIINLLSNALKFSDKGTITCSVNFDENQKLDIRINDEGIGMNEKVQENVFKKYYTLKKSDKIKGGVGLGLYISKKMLDSLQGTISFETKKDVGTTFKVLIPIPKPRFKDEKKPKFTHINQLPKEMNWLIVDDNALNLLYMKQFFSDHKHVKTAINGEEALKIVQDYPIDIIVTDINMPVMRGDELLVNIRKHRAWNHIKVISTSSDNEQVKELEKMHNIQFDAILIKPFNEKKLTQVIMNTLFPQPKNHVE